MYSSYIVLSPAKFESSISLMNKNKRLTKILNKIEPNMGPCGTPNKSLWKKLPASSDKPYPSRFPISKS